ncbi:MAG: hypothetical protein RTU09_04030 [Candidatus Thorarchaeota archaeon]
MDMDRDEEDKVSLEPRREVDWDEYVYQQEQDQSQVSLDATDYVAIFVASLTTIFLPIVILMVILMVIALAFGFIA